ncbi:Ig-like domain-containing protein [Streptomyces sp. TLI_235]|uniref:L,D-transpeptidase n=1 Tax=Kitasatospora sp. NPDC085879 TaxID=3154769 RepID=UPI000BCACFA9|nr:Ig-like domain-containing protein [Streptomyces sp. TLI_235]PBC77716.1 lipoprotein-anchoring transpeptidase ErfK/SrfK [Streptomyces sp. TLI_235]
MKPVQAAEAAIVRGAAASGRTGRTARTAAVALAMGGVLLFTAACNDGGSGGSGGSGGPAANAAGASGDSTTQAAPKTSAAVLGVSAKDGATDVALNGLTVTVASGKLTSVEVKDKNDKPVEGAIAADGLSWKPSAGLQPGMAYTVNAQAKDDAGLPAAISSGFTTLTPAKKVSTNDNIADNATYGVGMIVSVSFNKDVKNKDAVVKGITFETSNGTAVKGHWFGSRRLDFRPAEYWKPGTKVTVKYRLKSVEVAPGIYGDIDRDEPFTIGRYQVSTVDAAKHMMTVASGDGSAKSIPITAGNDQNPSWNGTMVISSKEKVTRMNSATVANVKGDEYDVPDVPHAMRLTTTGTYLHGNYWGNAFGKSNASHGCVGLRDVKGGSESSSAGTFFNSSLVGDVVKIVNSKGRTVSPDNGLSGWTLSWSAW